MRAIAVVGVFLAAAALLGSCAVTSGVTFGSVVEAEGSASEDDPTDEPDQDPKDDEEQAPLLTIETEPSGADVYLDGDYLGETPLEVDDVEPGRYRLRVERPGYYGYEEWVDIRDGISSSLALQLEQVTGFMRVVVEPTSADVWVDGSRIGSDVAELPIGTHTVTAYAFGYRRHGQTVRIQENQFAEVRIALEEAPFELSRLRVSRARFNPRNPGWTSRVELSFSVSAPGTGTAVITAPDGAVVEERELVFTHPEQRFVWDGRGPHGTPLPDGEYQVHVHGVGRRDGMADSLADAVLIDSSLRVALRSNWSSAPGFLFAPNPLVFPPETAQFSALVAGTVAQVDGQTVARFPIVTGVHIGFRHNLELSLRAGTTVQSASIDNRYFGGAALAWRFWSFSAGAFSGSVAVLAGGAIQSPSATGSFAAPDSRTDHTGGYLSAPFLVEVGPLAIAVTPEVRFAAAPVFYGPGALPANQLTVMGYLRGAVALMGRNVTAAISAAPRFVANGGNVSFAPPLAGGAELHWAVPELPVVLSALMTMEADSFGDFYLSGGGGFSLIN